ncbi:hypothetical protein [Anaerocellum danielii]|uniref:Uncharacterized protein n=1 Tax=Anaerocellum danielii TaxID=1387557 RepID=A0ABZ0U2C2_9FIRM|nr:hypothetical protein [Caldicellulosiruptor danielii]WPX08883.1 hypothetical protein SOJ16_000040 [Caldicellulosiruptor danielii]
MNEIEIQILDFLKRVQRRQIVCNFLAHLWQCVSASLAFVILIEALSKIFPIYCKSFYQVFILLLSFVIYAVFIISKKPDLKHSALTVDSFGLKERLTTALELIGVESEISKYIKQTTVQIIKNIDIKKIIKPRVEKNKWMVASLLFIVFFFLANVHSPKMDEAKRLHLLSSLKKNEILKIEKIKKEVLKSFKLNEVEKRKINEVLLKLKKEIKLAKTKNEIEFAKQKASFLINDLKGGSKNPKFHSALEKIKNSVLGENKLAQSRKKDFLTTANAKNNSTERSYGSANQSDGQKSQDKQTNTSFSEKEGSEKANNSQGTVSNGQEQTQQSQSEVSSGSENGTSSHSDTNANSRQNASGQGVGGGIQGRGRGEGASQIDNLNRKGSGLGAAIPRNSNKVQMPSIYTKNLLSLDASKKVLADTGQESGKVTQKQGIGERGQKLSYDRVFSQYKQEATEYIETEEVPFWAKEITKRYFENLENMR